MRLFPSPCRASLRSLLCGATLGLLAAATPTVRAQLPGDLDPTFTTGTEANGSVHAIALQADGKVIVGGQFSTYRDATRNSLARLNADGTLDAGFNPGLAISYYLGFPNEPLVRAVAGQADGKILAAGSFSVLGQTAGSGLVRLNPDGSLDTTFDVGSGVVDAGQAVGSGLSLAVLANGQILVGGDFASFDGVSVAGLVRLNADGSLDPTFNPGGAGITGNPQGSSVNSVVVQADGRIVIGGYFSAYDGQAAGCVARLNADGTLDTTFDVGTGAGSEGVLALGVQADGKVLVAGRFGSFDNLTVQDLVRVNADGSLDTGYIPNGGLFIEEIDAILVQPDGSALIGGEFLNQGGLVNTPADGLAHLFADGTEDAVFSGPGEVRQVAALLLQPDGRLLAAYDQDGFINQGPGDVAREYDVIIVTTPVVTTVSIAPGVATANEDGSSGPATFVLSLDAAQSTDTVVYYTVKGKAAAGYDYVPLKGKAKIKAGKTSKAIKVHPLDEQITGGGKVAVKVILQPDSGYTIGSANLAKVKIIDNQ